MKKEDIVDAWARIRSIDNTIPDDVLDFMKDSAIKVLDKQTLDINTLPLGYVVWRNAQNMTHSEFIKWYKERFGLNSGYGCLTNNNISVESPKEFYKKKITFKSVNPPTLGGQSCGIHIDVQQLKCEDLDLVLECGYSRSALKNRELLMIMFDAFMDEIIK